MYPVLPDPMTAMFTRHADAMTMVYIDRTLNLATASSIHAGGIAN